MATRTSISFFIFKFAPHENIKIRCTPIVDASQSVKEICSVFGVYFFIVVSETSLIKLKIFFLYLHVLHGSSIAK